MKSQRPLRRTDAFIKVWLLACALLLAGPHAAARAQAGGQAADASARVSVLLTALGRDGKFVGGVKAGDVRLSVDGSPREVLELKKQTGAPLFLAVVIDASASQERVLPNTKLAADVFVRGMLAPGDRAAVVTFAGEATLEQPLTDDVESVRAAIARVKFTPPPGYVGGGMIIAGTPSAADVNRVASTGVWDVVWLVSNDVLSRALGRGRRAVLLVTDGVDTSSRVKLSDAAQAALKSEAVVYAVGVGDDKSFDGVDKGALRKLAARTGGRAYFPKKLKELPDIFARISEELTSQYVLTFDAPTAARDGSFHKLKVELANGALRGAGVELSYPEGFYAGNAPTSVMK